jgi:hypothetical protein
MLTRSTIRIALALACAGLAQMPSALAQTLRCGHVLIQPGDDIRYVLEKCGEPTSRITMTEPVMANDTVYPIGIARAGLWRYHRAPGQFPVVLSIAEDGRVQAIEFERTRD